VTPNSEAALPTGASPVLKLLAEVVATRHPDAVERLWSTARQLGTPVVTPVAEEAGTWEVTYLWRATTDDVSGVLVRGAPVWPEDRHVLRAPEGVTAATRLRRVPGTDVWWRTFRAPSDLRAEYSFVELRGTQPAAPAADPLGSRWWPLGTSPYPPPADSSDDNGATFVELPDAPEFLRPSTSPSGSLTLHTVRSAVLGNSRRVWVWAPSTVPEAETPWELPVLVLHDGWQWTRPGASIAAIMDHLVHAGAVPPMVVLAHESPRGGRAELACVPEFVDFLTEELLPWARERWPIARLPERTAIAGQSLGGLNAVYAAHMRPDIFGAAIAQSGSFWWPGGSPYGREDGAMMRLLASERRPSVRFYLDVGLLEGRMVGLSRHLRDVLVAGGHDLTYRELAGGHSWSSWAPALPGAIRAVTVGWHRPASWVSTDTLSPATVPARDAGRLPRRSDAPSVLA
jgi:enterochelin esterase-like enzyme